MKKVKRIVLCILSLVLVLACGAGCNSCGKSKDKNAGGTQTPPNIYEDGRHDINVTDTQTDLLKNGQTAYKIVIPAAATAYEETAAEEIAAFFMQATGARLETVTDEGLTHSADAQYISVGNTTLKTGAGVAVDYAVLGESGYVIKTVGKSVFLVSASRVGFGTLYAGYEFLHHTVGYEAYGPQAIYLHKGIQNVKLPAFDITDVPDFEWRIGAFGQIYTKPVPANRMRMNVRNNGSVYVRVDGQVNHTMPLILPASKYAEAHSEWYSADKLQLCYTAGGNKESFDALVNETVEQCKQYIDAEETAEYFILGIGDNQSWCTCNACAAEKEKYGVDSAVQIKWVNAVAEKIENWLNTERDGRKLTIGVFAYNKVTDAPAKKGEDGKYAPIDDSVKLRSNVSVLYAPISANFTKSFYEDKNGFADTMDAWACLTEKLSLWIYQASYNDYFLPYDNFSSMQQNYVFAKERGVYCIFDQGQQNNNESSGFNNLKLYLSSKLQWNINQDVNELTRNWFNYMYGDAADSMMQLYDAMRVAYEKLEREEKVTGWVYQQPSTDEFWEQGTIESMLKYIDQAYAAIADLKIVDAAQYATVYDRICVESLTWRYLLIKIYGFRFAASDLYAMKTAFRDDCTRLGVNECAESVSVSTLWSTWGI